MKQVEIENQLREVVSRLINEVDLVTNQGRLDVNLISEEAWIPILKEVYQYPNLINLNRKHKYFPGTDLGMNRIVLPFTSRLQQILKRLNLPWSSSKSGTIKTHLMSFISLR